MTIAATDAGNALAQLNTDYTPLHGMAILVQAGCLRRIAFSRLAEQRGASAYPVVRPRLGLALAAVRPLVSIRGV